MTTFAGQSCPAREGHQRTTARLVFAWVLSPAAAARVGMSEGAEGLRLEILVPRPPACGPLGVRLVAGEVVRALEVADSVAGWTGEDERSLLHLDAPGILHATVRRADGEFEILYARTPLPGVLGVGGGRYDFEGVERG